MQTPGREDRVSGEQPGCDRSQLAAMVMTVMAMMTVVGLGVGRNSGAGDD